MDTLPDDEVSLDETDTAHLALFLIALYIIASKNTRVFIIFIIAFATPWRILP
jgi:hypothetical protein